MDSLVRILGKPFADLTVNEQITLFLLVVACLLFVLYAISVLVQLSKKFEVENTQGIPRSFKKGLGRAGEVDVYEELRVTHSD